VTIRELESTGDVIRCFEVMNQLRTHLDLPTYLERIHSQRKSGYRLACAEVDGRVAAVAGFRVIELLAHGRVLYVDDLVTDAAVRSSGHGKALLGWLVEEARRCGCGSLQLDSNAERLDAHRFYAREGMEKTSFHFRMRVGSD
jgi:GNAT superfamily N-acetyltransferase